VTVSLDDDGYEALKTHAEQEDVSISWLIRRAVNDMISVWSDSTTKKRSGK
jgi:predicted transcriptional regulator